MSDRSREHVEPRFKRAPEPPKRRAHNSTLAAPTQPINAMSEHRKKRLMAL